MKIKTGTSEFFLTSLKWMSLILCIGTAACNHDNSMKKYFAEFLKRVDKVQIQYFNKGDTLTKTLTEQHHVDAYKQVINGKKRKDLPCDSTGRFLYFVKDTLLFEAYFSLPSTGSKYERGAITYYLKPDLYTTLFAYRAYMIADEYFYQLTKVKTDTTNIY